MKLKQINEAFNDELNDMMENGILPLKGKISPRGVKLFNDELNKDIEAAYIDESLDDKNSLRRHYNKHVLKQGEVSSSKNKGKYNYMTKEDYYNYAIEIANKTPTFTIDTSIVNKDDADDIIDDYDVSSSAILKIDYNLTSKRDGKPMVAIFNKPSKYSRFSEVCLVEKDTGKPITIYPLPGGRFFSLTRKFLAD